jgi:hypothetical protein
MNENEILEEEIAEIVGDEDTTDRVDDEFEYDENGDIIIPDVDEDNEEEAVADEETEEESEDTAEGEENASESGDGEEDEETPAEEEKVSESEELARLRALVKSYETQTKDTLSKLGVQSDDALKGLAQLAAEADGKTTDEYVAELKKKERAEKAEAMLKNAEYEAMAAADLAGLKAIYPELKDVTRIENIPNFTRFGALRDKGLSLKEAYSAANADDIRSNVASAVTRQNLNETKAHLKSNVPKKTVDTSLRIPKAEFDFWRDLFPDKSDKQIAKIYREAHKKN